MKSTYFCNDFKLRTLGQGVGKSCKPFHRLWGGPLEAVNELATLHRNYLAQVAFPLFATSLQQD